MEPSNGLCKKVFDELARRLGSSLALIFRTVLHFLANLLPSSTPLPFHECLAKLIDAQPVTRLTNAFKHSTIQLAFFEAQNRGKPLIVFCLSDQTVPLASFEDQRNVLREALCGNSVNLTEGEGISAQQSAAAEESTGSEGITPDNEEQRRAFVDDLISQCVVYGFHSNFSAEDRCLAALLGVKASSILSMTVILPLQLAPHLQNSIFGSRGDNNLFGGSTWAGLPTAQSNVDQEAIMEGIQNIYAVISSEAPENCVVGLKPVRGGMLHCISMDLITTEGGSETDAATLRLRMQWALDAGIRMSAPVKHALDEKAKAREADRKLRQLQEEEFQESLRADREKSRKAAEEKQRLQQAAELEREHDESCEMAARELLSRECELDAANCARIQLRYSLKGAPGRRVLIAHRSLRVSQVEEAVRCARYLLSSHEVLHILPSSCGGTACRQESLRAQPEELVLPRSFKLSCAAVPQHREGLPAHLTIEEAGLMPNAVIHIVPLAS